MKAKQTNSKTTLIAVLIVYSKCTTPICTQALRLLPIEPGWLYRIDRDSLLVAR